MEVEALVATVALSTALGCAIFLGAWLVEPLMVDWWIRRRPEREEEKGFPAHASSQSGKFPSLFSDAELVDLSVVVLARNQEARLAVLLDEALSFLRGRSVARRGPEAGAGGAEAGAGFRFEVVVVDMASSDATAETALRFTNKYGSDVVRLLRVDWLSGRGTAMAKGVLRSRGKRVLVIEGDGSVPFSDLTRLERALDRLGGGSSGDGVAIGSWAHALVALQDKNLFAVLRPRGAASRLLLGAFRALFNVLCVEEVFDTQCPCKLFSRSAARRLFSSAHVQSLGTDAELVYLCKRLQIPLTEQAVGWEQLDDSETQPVKICMQLVRDLLVMRFCYLTGVWKAKRG